MQEYRKDSDDAGGLLMMSQAAVLLEISSQRISQLVADGRFTKYEHFDKCMVGAAEITEYMRVKKISGQGGQKQKVAWETTKAEAKADFATAIKTFKKAIRKA